MKTYTVTTSFNFSLDEETLVLEAIKAFSASFGQKLAGNITVKNVDRYPERFRSREIEVEIAINYNYDYTNDSHINEKIANMYFEDAKNIYKLLFYYICGSCKNISYSQFPYLSYRTEIN